MYVLIAAILILLNVSHQKRNPNLENHKYKTEDARLREKLNENKRDLENFYRINKNYQYVGKHMKMNNNMNMILNELDQRKDIFYDLLDPEDPESMNLKPKEIKEYYKYLFSSLKYQNEISVYADRSIDEIPYQSTNILLNGKYKIDNTSILFGYDSQIRDYGNEQIINDKLFKVGIDHLLYHDLKLMFEMSFGRENQILPNKSFYIEGDYRFRQSGFTVGLRNNMYLENESSNVLNVGVDYSTQNWTFYVKEYFTLNTNKDILKYHVVKGEVEYRLDYKTSIKGSIAIGEELIDLNQNSDFVEYNLELKYKMTPRFQIKPILIYHDNNYYDEKKIGLGVTWFY